MNIKVNFSCIEISQGDITRYDLEVIKDFNFDHFSNYLDNNIPYICDLFDFNLVLDWKVNKYEETLDIPTEITLVNSCSGKIIFDDDINQKILEGKSIILDKIKELAHLKKMDYITLEYLNKNQEIKQVKEIIKKDHASCWINLSGEVFYVDFAEHNSWAYEYLKENNTELFDDLGISLKNSWKDPYVILEESGWIRILGWRDPPCFSLPDRITPKQKQSLREYCIKEELKYSDFPEIT